MPYVTFCNPGLGLTKSVNTPLLQFQKCRMFWKEYWKTQYPTVFDAACYTYCKFSNFCHCQTDKPLLPLLLVMRLPNTCLPLLGEEYCIFFTPFLYYKECSSYDSIIHISTSNFSHKYCPLIAFDSSLHSPPLQV